MSQGFAKVGTTSPIADNRVGVPTAVRISGDGLRAFHRSRYNTVFPAAYGLEGHIAAVDWDGENWTIVSGIGGQTGGGEIWDEGKNEFQISKNGACVAWDFQYQSPNSFGYTGIHVSGQNSQLIYAFVPSDPAAPSLATGTQVTPFANTVSSGLYVPKKIRFSDDASRRFVYFQSFNNLIEVNPGSSGNSSIWFPYNGTYGNNLQNFEISGDGNHLFVFVGGSLKMLSWDGADWQFSHEFTTAGNACAVNFDGSLVAIRDSGVKVFQKTGSTWAQRGYDFEDGTVWLNSTGDLLNVASQLFEWTGADWSPRWITTGKTLSDNAQAAISPSGVSSVQRYEITSGLPFYHGSDFVTAIYAGAAEGKAIYSGSSLLWNVEGWTP